MRQEEASYSSGCQLRENLDGIVQGTFSTINGELVGLITKQADDNLLASMRDKSMKRRIGNIR